MKKRIIDILKTLPLFKAVWIDGHNYGLEHYAEPK